eukprot:7735093-Alexandrium_andersonii.AAC.1
MRTSRPVGLSGPQPHPCGMSASLLWQPVPRLRACAPRAGAPGADLDEQLWHASGPEMPSRRLAAWRMRVILPSPPCTFNAL